LQAVAEPPPNPAESPQDGKLNGGASSLSGKRKGETIEQLQAAITPASLKSLGGSYGEFVGGQITKYDGPQMRVSPRDAVAGAVRSNIAEIFKALDKA
jgi:hypothetical protein